MAESEAVSHAAEATAKADRMFKNDQVPAFQAKPAPGSPEAHRRASGLRKKSLRAVGLEVQKHLAWAAMHLLFYLETECREMAKEVSMGFGFRV